jgi:hypothetical protein
MLVHCCWDVPGHRWATAGFALAALALACPINPEKSHPIGRRFALIPLVICIFWALPFCFNGPAFSPTTLAKLTQRLEISPARVPSRAMLDALLFFPLTPELHHAMGVHGMNSESASEAWKHFQIADRLRPASWSLPASQALASQPVSAGMALHFWTLAIERAGHRNTEIFQMAYRRTIALPVATPLWARYAETNPEFLLTYAQSLPDAEARSCYDLWVKVRSASNHLGQEEVADYYSFVSRFGDPVQFTYWMEAHPELKKTDFRSWARLLHRWGEDTTAWRLLSAQINEPPWPRHALSTRTELLEANWLKNPSSIVNAQALADAYQRVGDPEGCRKIILSSAQQKNAPAWFLQKAAFIHAADNRLSEAVDCILRIAEKGG